jgi:hypothetical protein
MLKVKVRVTLRLVVYRQSVRLNVKPLRLTTTDLFFQLSPYGNIPHVTSSLTRRWGFSFMNMLGLSSSLRN